MSTIHSRQIGGKREADGFDYKRRSKDNQRTRLISIKTAFFHYPPTGAPRRTWKRPGKRIRDVIKGRNKPIQI